MFNISSLFSSPIFRRLFFVITIFSVFLSLFFIPSSASYVEEGSECLVPGYYRFNDHITSLDEDLPDTGSELKAFKLNFTYFDEFSSPLEGYGMAIPFTVSESSPIDTRSRNLFYYTDSDISNFSVSYYFPYSYFAYGDSDLYNHFRGGRDIIYIHSTKVTNADGSEDRTSEFKKWLNANAVYIPEPDYDSFSDFLTVDTDSFVPSFWFDTLTIPVRLNIAFNDKGNTLQRHVSSITFKKDSYGVKLLFLDDLLFYDDLNGWNFTNISFSDFSYVDFVHPVLFEFLADCTAYRDQVFQNVRFINTNFPDDTYDVYLPYNMTWDDYIASDLPFSDRFISRYGVVYFSPDDGTPVYISELGSDPEYVGEFINSEYFFEGVSFLPEEEFVIKSGDNSFRYVVPYHFSFLDFLGSAYCSNEFTVHDGFVYFYGEQLILNGFPVLITDFCLWGYNYEIYGIIDPGSPPPVVDPGGSLPDLDIPVNQSILVSGIYTFSPSLLSNESFTEYVSFESCGQKFYRITVSHPVSLTDSFKLYYDDILVYRSNFRQSGGGYGEWTNELYRYINFGSGSHVSSKFNSFLKDYAFVETDIINLYDLAFDKGFKHGYLIGKEESSPSMDEDEFGTWFTYFLQRIVESLDALKFIGSYSLLDLLKVLVGFTVVFLLLKFVT